MNHYKLAQTMSHIRIYRESVVKLVWGLHEIIKCNQIWAISKIEVNWMMSNWLSSSLTSKRFTWKIRYHNRYVLTEMERKWNQWVLVCSSFCIYTCVHLCLTITWIGRLPPLLVKSNVYYLFLNLLADRKDLENRKTMLNTQKMKKDTCGLNISLDELSTL